MNKGQNAEGVIKNILKIYKVNENLISTILGGVVIFSVAIMIFSYFKATNLKTWQGLLDGQKETATTSTDENKSDGNTDTYIVVKGDDLWHIAEKYYKSGYNYVDIMKVNKIASNGVVTPGMKLLIPKVEAKKITVMVEKNAAIEMDKDGNLKKVEKSAEAGTYTTVKGDSLWKIAVSSYGDGYAWTKIYQANKKLISNPNVLYAGLTLTIPSLK